MDIVDAIASLITKDYPTEEQHKVIKLFLSDLGNDRWITRFDWDKQLTIKFAAPVLRRVNQVWVFGLDGGMQFIPDITKLK